MASRSFVVFCAWMRTQRRMRCRTLGWVFARRAAKVHALVRAGGTVRAGDGQASATEGDRTGDGAANLRVRTPNDTPRDGVLPSDARVDLQQQTPSPSACRVTLTMLGTMTLTGRLGGKPGAGPVMLCLGAMTFLPGAVPTHPPLVTVP